MTPVAVVGHLETYSKDKCSISYISNAGAKPDSQGKDKLSPGCILYDP